MASEPKIPRFSLVERVIHWTVALSFLYAALSGLALWSPRLYWLASVLGAGSSVGRWHPWAGVVFAGIFSVMFSRWNRQMRLDHDDRFWLRHAHQFVMHEESGMLESGRFNGGQKALFWMQAASGVVLLVTGIVLWWPEVTPRVFRTIAILLHPAAAVLSIGGLIVHIYMGTAAVPEAFRGMAQGWVRPRWALTHHPKWYREIWRR